MGSRTPTPWSAQNGTRGEFAGTQDSFFATCYYLERQIDDPSPYANQAVFQNCFSRACYLFTDRSNSAAYRGCGVAI
jgi:hypothetical protein